MADWTPLRSLLAPVTDSVTLRWDDLEALVGGLPRSAYDHSAFWKGARSGWPGFSTANVRIGESVTFVRSGAPPAPTRLPLPRPMARTEALATADVILIGCVKRKLSTAASAKDLYVSPLFRQGRAYAELAGVPWFILSAQHGLVAPDDVLEPYDLRLSATSREYRRVWGARVVGTLREALGSLDGLSVEVHAGSAYADAIREGLRSEGARVAEPLAGLKLGPRLSWYGRPGTPTPPPAHPRPDVDDLVARLLRAGEAISPDDFLATGAVLFRSPGLYNWWVDAGGAADLSNGLQRPIEPGLIYAGLAGATRSGGRKSKNTLWGRIKTMHLGGRHEFSTFRLSLGSVLAESRGDQEIDEPGLTAWMHEHLRLIAVPVDDADTLGDVETEVLLQLDPPLNLDKVARNPLRTQLSALRKKYGRKRRSASSASAG